MHWETMRNNVWRYGVGWWLRLVAHDELQLLRRARAATTIAVFAALLALFYAPFSATPLKLVNIAGIAFDIAGALRLFIAEDVASYLEPFRDEEKYPYGPPSVAMRELIMPEASPYADDEVPHINHALFHKRGVLYLLIGFSLQLLAALLG